MSSLRARCPDCHTLTAVALGPSYQCHACGREFAAGLVRVPRAWGSGGEAMAEAAVLEIPYPETAIVERDTLEEQTSTLAALLPERPLVLGGCCCAHIGAVTGLARRRGRLGVVWLDAHGDLNTPATSPSGDLWGMPLRMILDEGQVAASDVALVGARNLDPGELDFLASSRIDDSLDRALTGVTGVYVALDMDVLTPGEVACFMPEPGGPTVGEVEAILREVAGRADVAGVGVTTLVQGEGNVSVVTRLLAAVGF
jgi:arginase